MFEASRLLLGLKIFTVVNSKSFGEALEESVSVKLQFKQQRFHIFSVLNFNGLLC